MEPSAKWSAAQLPGPHYHAEPQLLSGPPPPLPADHLNLLHPLPPPLLSSSSSFFPTPNPNPIPFAPPPAYYPIAGTLGAPLLLQNGQTSTVDLEKKKQKLIDGGAAAESVRTCTMCNVVCNSEKVFASHLAGEKHKAIERSYNGLFPLLHVRTKIVHQVKKAAITASNTLKKTLKGAMKDTRAAYCEVCKLECNSTEVFNAHILGRKHKKKLQQLQESMTPKPVGALVSPVENNGGAAEKAEDTCQNVNKRITPAALADVETKRMKVLAQGAAAAAVRVCDLCNVVCNSETVFSSHLSGQKHATMVKKLDEQSRMSVDQGNQFVAIKSSIVHQIH